MDFEVNFWNKEEQPGTFAGVCPADIRPPCVDAFNTGIESPRIESPLQLLGPPPPNDFTEEYPFNFRNSPRVTLLCSPVRVPRTQQPPAPYPDGSTALQPSPRTEIQPESSHNDAELLRAMTENMVALNRRAEAAHHRVNDIEALATGLMSGVQTNTTMMQALSKQVACLTQRFADCKKYGIKVTATTRPENASKLLAQLVYNGTQTSSGFLCILCYASAMLNRDVIVVSLLSIALLCSRVSLPSRQRDVSSVLLTLGFTAGANFTEAEIDDLMDIFCLSGVKTTKTRRKRFYSMPADQFFEMLQNLDVPPAVRIRENFGPKFKVHDLSDEKQAYMPSVGTALWEELYEIWGNSLDNYIMRARARLNMEPLSTKRRTNVHGIEPSAGRVLSFEHAQQARRARARRGRR